MRCLRITWKGQMLLSPVMTAPPIEAINVILHHVKVRNRYYRFAESQSDTVVLKALAILLHSLQTMVR